MRIYGGHDYYDCGMALGRDPSVTLVREKSRSIPVKVAGGSLLKRSLELHPQWTNETNGVGISTVAVVFCKKVYRGVIGLHALDKNEGIWSAARARAFVGQQKKRTVVVETHWRDPKMTLEDWFAPFDAPPDLYSYMLMNKVSILLEEDESRVSCEDHSFRVNPTGLKQLGFAKAIDPYTAFQELSMWIGGVLGGTSPELVKITDDRTLIEGHGFDNRFSFRGPRI